MVSKAMDPHLLMSWSTSWSICFWKWGIPGYPQYGNMVMLGEIWWSASGLPIFGVWEATNRRSHFKHQVAIKVQRNMVKVRVCGDVPGHNSVATSEIQLRNLDPALIHRCKNISWWFKSTMRRCLTYSEFKLGYQCLIHYVFLVGGTSLKSGRRGSRSPRERWEFFLGAHGFLVAMSISWISIAISIYIYTYNYMYIYIQQYQ
jgi:hypothetical protein